MPRGVYLVRGIWIYNETITQFTPGFGSNFPVHIPRSRYSAIVSDLRNPTFSIQNRTFELQNPNISINQHLYPAPSPTPTGKTATWSPQNHHFKKGKNLHKNSKNLHFCIKITLRLNRTSTRRSVSVMQKLLPIN